MKTIVAILLSLTVACVESPEEVPAVDFPTCNEEEPCLSLACEVDTDLCQCEVYRAESRAPSYITCAIEP